MKTASKTLNKGASKQTYDWLEPWWNVIKLANLLLSHAVGIWLIDAFARLLEIGIGLISPQTLVWTFKGVSVSLSDVTNYADLFVIVVFLIVAFVDVIKWARQR